MKRHVCTLLISQLYRITIFCLILKGVYRLSILKFVTIYLLSFTKLYMIRTIFNVNNSYLKEIHYLHFEILARAGAWVND